jgi:hypothetical protein
MSLADNPEALASYVRHLGGEPIEARTFQFEIPLSEARRVIPEINRLGLRCEKISERQDSDINGRACSIATVEVSHQPAPTEYERGASLMAVACRGSPRN